MKQQYLRRLLNNGGKIGSKVFKSTNTMRQELEQLGIERLERLARHLHLVRRDEFESVQAMVKEMRHVQEELRVHLTNLEQAIGVKASLKNKGAPQKKPAPSGMKPTAKLRAKRTSKNTDN